MTIKNTVDGKNSSYQCWQLYFARGQGTQMNKNGRRTVIYYSDMIQRLFCSDHTSKKDHLRSRRGNVNWYESAIAVSAFSVVGLTVGSSTRGVACWRARRQHLYRSYNVPRPLVDRRTTLSWVRELHYGRTIIVYGIVTYLLCTQLVTCKLCLGSACGLATPYKH